jgi:hypothetical protein
LKYELERTDGQRQTKFRSFKGTRKQAEAELARLLAQVADGQHVESGKLTVAVHLRARCKHWQAIGEISARTAERYNQLIEDQIIPHLGGKLLSKLSTTDIEVWQTILLTGTRKRKPRGGLSINDMPGLSPTTIAAAQRILSKSLNEAMRHNLILRNPCTLQTAPPNKKGKKCGSSRRSKLMICRRCCVTIGWKPWLWWRCSPEFDVASCWR